MRRDLQRLRAAETVRPVAASCRALPFRAGVYALKALAEETLVAAMAEPAALRLHPRRMLVVCCQSSAAAVGRCHVTGHIVPDATGQVVFILGVPRVALVEQGFVSSLPEHYMYAAEQRYPS